MAGCSSSGSKSSATGTTGVLGSSSGANRERRGSGLNVLGFRTGAGAGWLWTITLGALALTFLFLAAVLFLMIDIALLRLRITYLAQEINFFLTLSAKKRANRPGEAHFSDLTKHKSEDQLTK